MDNAAQSAEHMLTQAFGTRMKAHGGGSIDNVGSTYALSAPDQSIYRDDDGKQVFFKSAGYPVAKAGVVHLSKYCAAYWGHDGVRVNVLCPGGVFDDQEPGFVKRYAQRTPMGRMAEPTDYNGACVFLMSDASAYMTGSVVSVDGGGTTW